ncbi:hypothetical protein [Nocardia alba]|uniref:Uncharacterized protein n=1 Tax=Nocardia alba TaxID=225051 RepID=A0A4R1F7B0_9NOCA|nr:hypothetical protein [Nocardia alba]TCJ90196.1 hypothetical protein DFR71_6086 [Nocardia alba]
MLTFLIVLTVIIAFAVLIGRGTAGSTGIVDRDAQRMNAELTAIAGYTRPDHR